jgi:serine/threonine protein kinase
VPKTTARRVGRYELVREIGRGGMSAVYLARQSDLQRDVVLKELSLFEGADPALAPRFLRDARLAGSRAPEHRHGLRLFERRGRL